MYIYIPTRSPDDWRRLLADPDNQWRTGYSAKTLAYCWEDAQLSDSFPRCVQKALDRSGCDEVRDLDILFAFPEHRVQLPGGERPSQTDLFVLAANKTGRIAIAVEGKVHEPFGALVKDWQADSSPGKDARLEFLCTQLETTPAAVQEARYQLLHRTVSAIIEAERFGAETAMLLVHAFGTRAESYCDYERFAQLLGAAPERNSVCRVPRSAGCTLLLGWADGDPEFCER